MHNFVFHNPTKILFGKQTLPSIGPETKAFGSRAMLIYGRQSLKQNGTYQQIVQSLAAAGVEVTEFGNIQANPLLSRVREGIQVAKKEKVEVVIGAGGGSVIDTAKAIAAGAVVEHDVWKFFTGKKGVKGTLPVNTVLTLPASGSEMNSGMVLTHDEKKQKFGFGHRFLFPKTSILDPELSYTVPPDYTAYGAVDAISHILEFYLTTADPDTPVQDRFMEGLIASIMNACNRCLTHPRDYGGRASLMWSATLALNGLTAAGLGRVGFPMHLLEHSLSGLYNSAHGAGLAALLPGWLHYYKETAPERLAMLGKGIFPETISANAPPAERAEQCITQLLQWLREINVPTSLAEMGVTAADIPTIAEHSSGLAKIWRLREYSKPLLENILTRCC